MNSIRGTEEGLPLILGVTVISVSKEAGEVVPFPIKPIGHNIQGEAQTCSTLFKFYFPDNRSKI